jgi:hypothetical protein
MLNAGMARFGRTAVAAPACTYTLKIVLSSPRGATIVLQVWTWLRPKGARHQVSNSKQVRR